MAAVNAFGFTPGKPHPNLVVCAVPSEDDLDIAFNRLKELKVPCCAWYEDDMQGRLTAIATGPLTRGQRKHMSHFKLLKS